MNPDPQRQRFQQKQKQQQSEEVQSSQKKAGETFESVEELLRHDAAQTDPPSAIAARLKDTLEREPVQKGPWWKRLFS